MDDKLITIAEYHEHLEAQMLKDYLEAEGIKAVIIGEKIHGLYPLSGMQNVQVQVFQNDVEKATKILDEYEASQDQEDSN